MGFCPSFDFTMRAESFFFNLCRALLGNMLEFKYSSAKYAIVLGNDKLTMLGRVGFFKVADLVVFHISLSLSAHHPHRRSLHPGARICPCKTCSQTEVKDSRLWSSGLELFLPKSPLGWAWLNSRCSLRANSDLGHPSWHGR